MLALAMPKHVLSIDEQSPVPPGGVDVSELIEKVSVEELAMTADEYFASQMDGVDFWHAKPFWHNSEVVDMVITFAHVLDALRLSPGMRVLDFGAGTGWTSRYLSQLDCSVIVSDVSPTALELARQLYERQPVIGNKPAPEFLRFDGHHIDLPDASVDRVICFDALHHTANPDRVLAEMGRVLKPGGRAAFSEPGPNHSKGPQSQFEMKNFTVVENDIKIRSIEKWAYAAGFDDLKLAVYTGQPFYLSPDGYERLLARRSEAWHYLEHHRPYLEGRRLLCLHRAGDEAPDSRVREGLAGTLSVSLDDETVDEASTIHGSFEAHNTGESLWLPSSSLRGPVRIGVHLYDAAMHLVDISYARIDLPTEDGVSPGGTVAGRFELAAPTAGSYVLQFDLVSEGVAWFETNGTTPADLPLEVGAVSSA